MPREFIREYNRLIAQGKDTIEAVAEIRKRAGTIISPPSGFYNYISKNIQTKAQLNNAPEWITNNFASYLDFTNAIYGE